MPTSVGRSFLDSIPIGKHDVLARFTFRPDMRGNLDSSFIAPFNDSAVPSKNNIVSSAY